MATKEKLALNFIRTKFRLLSRLSKKNAAAKAFQLFCTPQSRNINALPGIFEEAEKLHFSFDGNKVIGYRWNHPSSKKLLILHGFESSVINFEDYIRPLTAKGFEVLAFDAPAHGRSPGKSLNVLTYKNMILHIQKNFGPLNAFIAHSFGGLSISLALEEISHDEHTKLVLIAPASETKTAIDNFFRLLRLDAGVRVEFDKLILETGGNTPEWFSVSRAADHIHAQVLFLQDKDDHMTPLKDVEPIIRKNLPNFRFIISEGLGHSRIYRDKQSVKKITEFL